MAEQQAGYVTMFEALKETFPDDVIRRLLRSILVSRLVPIAEDGDTEGLTEELKLIAQEAYQGTMDGQLKSVDERLQEFYHIGDVYYEIAGEGTLDYHKLARSLNLPPDVIRKMEDEEMGYEDAQDFLFDLYRQAFERDQQQRLERLQAQLAADALRVVSTQSSVAGGDGSTDNRQPITANRTERRVRSLLETIDNTFPLSATSAARYVEAETGNKSKSMMAAAQNEVVTEIQEQLLDLYTEVEKTLGDVFMETTGQLPLIALVDNRLPRPVYRQIEERLGLEGLEQVENLPLVQLPADVQEIVKDAFVRWQESDLMLRVIDYLWTRHLTTMEQLRHSIGLQAYGQKDPLVQYKVKAYELFDELKGEIRQLAVLNVLLLGSKAEAARAANRPAPSQPQRQAAGGDGRAAQARGGNGKAPGQPQKPKMGQAARPGAPTAVAAGAGARAKIGRNDPCFCGSGKKYKHCHGR